MYVYVCVNMWILTLNFSFNDLLYAGVPVFQTSISTITNEEAMKSENSEIQENTEPETRNELKNPNRPRSSKSEVKDAGNNLQKSISLFEETVRKGDAPPDEVNYTPWGSMEYLWGWQRNWEHSLRKKH